MLFTQLRFSANALIVLCNEGMAVVNAFSVCNDLIFVTIFWLQLREFTRNSHVSCIRVIEKLGLTISFWK